jgi:hypothetical protein
MAYGQNTISNANSSNVYVSALEALLTTAGWTLVESLTPSGTFKTDVWKSAGAGNLAGYDWYLAILWNTIGSQQTVDIIAGGAYDLPSHTISQIPADLQSGTKSGAGYVPYAEVGTGDLWGGYMVNVATDTNTQVNWPHTLRSQNKPWHSAITPSSAFGYWFSVTRDHVVMFTTIDGLFYIAGTLHLDANWHSYPVPPVLNPLASTSKFFTGISAALIGIDSSAGGNNANYIAPRVRPNVNVGILLPDVAGNYLPAYAWKREFFLDHIGSYEDFYFVNGGSVGDTVTIGGGTYVITGPVGPPTTETSFSIQAYVAVLVE